MPDLLGCKRVKLVNKPVTLGSTLERLGCRQVKLVSTPETLDCKLERLASTEAMWANKLETLDCTPGRWESIEAKLDCTLDSLLRHRSHSYHLQNLVRSYHLPASSQVRS